ncbi:hypothetical protein VTH06DRAFT_7575 [Thermothelomyces fergusii]
MDDTNGTARTSSAPRAVNGINGATKSPVNSHGPSSKPRTKRRGPGLFAQTLSIAARLLTWYAILTILFRCPASLDACDDTSPRICKPYFQLKHAVAPHVEPYYDAYAAPYVRAVRPYYDTVDEKILTPSWAYVRQHGTPRLQQAQAFVEGQWEKTVQPQVKRYQSVARAQYDEKLAPHVDAIATALGPYCEIARTNMLQTYHELLVPAYLYVQPHLVEGYRATSTFASNTIFPTCVWAWNKTYNFLNGTVGPQIRAIYVETVEPQLVKIGKRLGRYSTGKKSVPKPPTDSSSRGSVKTTSSFTKPAVSVTAAPTAIYTSLSSSSSSSSSAAAASAVDTKKERVAAESPRLRSTLQPIPPPEVDEKLEKEDPRRRETREIVAADLKDWQERYAKAADEAAAEIDERVWEITRTMMRQNARVTGKAHLERLQATAVDELSALRGAIIEIIGTVKKGDATPEDGQAQIVKAVRKAGLAVKEKGQAVRTWREDYEKELESSVTQAAEIHFTILENIRDLALQKIGMKWAWTDGITYKDWAKYHQLKGRFDEWKNDLRNHVTSHPSIELAQIEAANIEDEAMEVAASTAKELARLKQVANWKLTARDDTPEFDSTLMQQAAEAAEAARLAAASAARAIGDAAKKAEDSGLDEGSEGVSVASEGVSQPSGVVLGSKEAGGGSVQQGGNPAEVAAASEPSEPSSEPAVEASLILEDSQSSPTEDPRTADATESEALASSEDASDPGDKATAGPVDPSPEELSSVADAASEPTPIVSDRPEAVAQPESASSMIFEAPVLLGNATEEVGEAVSADNAISIESPPEESGTTEEEDDNNEDLPVSETATVRPAIFGAAAQSVPNRRPILDADTLDDVSAVLESMREDLKSAYTSAMSLANDQYSQALSLVSAQIRGTPEPVHEGLLASVTAAYSKAMASASSRLDDAIKGASTHLYGSTTTRSGILPTELPVPEADWSHVQSIASERLQQGLRWAEEQYESAKVAVGLATPTPSTPAEHVNKMLDNARHSYYANIGLAHARYSEFLAAASSALSSMTAAPTPTDAAGSAAAGWDAVVAQISLRVYGAPAPTPWYAAAHGAASEAASSATSAAGAYASAGSAELARQYAAVRSILSEALVGSDPSFSESVVSRLSAAYATGAAAASSVASAAAEAVGDKASSLKDEL